MNKRGVALILGFMVITVLTILGSAIMSRSISEAGIAQRYLESTQAFWLAEAAVNQALGQLRTDYNLTSLANTALGVGGYSATIVNNADGSRTVIAHGFIPAAGQFRAERILQVVMNRLIPPYFYDNAVYSAGEVEFKGAAYSVSNPEASPNNKAVLYAGDFDVEHPGNITGTATLDASIDPLARLDFQQLLAISQGQGNVYDTTRLDNVKNGTDNFPASFWYSPGVANVVYVLSDLELKGNLGTIGGFFVVVGDVITNPSATYDATISGNGQIEGAIYTRGEFEVNGGGGGLNVNGGVWAGEETGLNGNAHIVYNQDYMSAIEALNINPEVQIISWQDTQNPYSLGP